MPADLADSQKADEEDRKSDHAPLVAVTKNEVTTVTATIETNLRQGDLEGDFTETETAGDEALSEWAEEFQKSRADELRCRSLLRRVFFCGRATAWTEVHRERAVAGLRKRTRQCCVFFFLIA